MSFFYIKYVYFGYFPKGTSSLAFSQTILLIYKIPKISLKSFCCQNFFTHFLLVFNYYSILFVLFIIFVIIFIVLY